MNNMLASMLLYGSIVVMQVQGFVFGGLSLRATINELRTKYPLSLVVDQRVYLSDAERHDDISTIEFSGAAGQRTLMLFFERRENGEAVYPRCETVRATLERRYGAPSGVQDATEEQARNRRFLWSNTSETLTLDCFAMPGQLLYAERMTMASRQ